MKRMWFQAKDGSYFRNCPLILEEMEQCIGRPWKFRQLHKELKEARKIGLLRKNKLGWGDELVPMAPFRET
jgi:hypothetical protein